MCEFPVSRKTLGFSLIEMLVALVILSLSLGVLYQAATSAIRNVGVAEQYSRAVMLGESLLAENTFITQEQFSESGEFSEFSWEVQSWPAPIEDGNRPPDSADGPLPVTGIPLQTVKVWVRWPGRTAPRQIELATIVPLREPPP